MVIEFQNEHKDDCSFVARMLQNMRWGKIFNYFTSIKLGHFVFDFILKCLNAENNYDCDNIANQLKTDLGTRMWVMNGWIGRHLD